MNKKETTTETTKKTTKKTTRETPEYKLKKEIRNLKKEAQPFLAYKRLILTAAKSEYDPKDIVEGLKFAATQIKKKNWVLGDRVGGTSGDLIVRGMCSKCEINLVGKEMRPREFTLPCLIKDCPFNSKNQLTEKPTNIETN